MQLSTEMIKNYLIDCIGYSEQDFEDLDYKDLKTLLEDSSPQAVEGCKAYNGLDNQINPNTVY